MLHFSAYEENLIDLGPDCRDMTQLQSYPQIIESSPRYHLAIAAPELERSYCTLPETMIDTAARELGDQGVTSVPISGDNENDLEHPGLQDIGTNRAKNWLKKHLALWVSFYNAGVFDTPEARKVNALNQLRQAGILAAFSPPKPRLQTPGYKKESMTHDLPIPEWELNPSLARSTSEFSQDHGKVNLSRSDRIGGGTKPGSKQQTMNRVQHPQPSKSARNADPWAHNRKRGQWQESPSRGSPRSNRGDSGQYLHYQNRKSNELKPVASSGSLGSPYWTKRRTEECQGESSSVYPFRKSHFSDGSKVVVEYREKRVNPIPRDDEGQQSQQMERDGYSGGVLVGGLRALPEDRWEDRSSTRGGSHHW